MQPKLSLGAARVYDDFVPDSLGQSLWQMMNEAAYTRVDVPHWIKVWTLADGAILRSTQWIASASNNWKVVEYLPNGGTNPPPGPKPLGEFVGYLRQCLADHPDMPDIQHVLITPYIWPPKTSISWHRDGTRADNTRVGAFTYYVHQEWNAEWGGEFLLSEVDAALPEIVFDNSELSDTLMSSGHGMWVSPKPNRAIVNPSDMYHKVAKTTDAAAPRMSLQGFLFS